jgi:hypothetical protein
MRFPYLLSAEALGRWPRLCDTGGCVQLAGSGLVSIFVLSALCCLEVLELILSPSHATA